MKNFIILTLLLSAATAFSQTTARTLNEKWASLLDKAETYEHYKVIKKVELNEFWRSVQDSVSDLKTELKQERIQIKQQAEQTALLQKTAEEMKAHLETTKNEKDNMHFLGMSVNKYNYATYLWVTILLALTGCVALFFLFQNRNRVTVQKINEHEQLSHVFEEYKHRKIEMERKLKREIQTYINKIEELKGKKV